MCAMSALINIARNKRKGGVRSYTNPLFIRLSGTLWGLFFMLFRPNWVHTLFLSLFVYLEIMKCYLKAGTTA